jgi:hypothetical protein
VLAVVLLAAPLHVVTPRLMETKRGDTYAYAALGTAHGQAFDSKWVHGLWLDQEALLARDIQPLSDLDNSFSVIREMRITAL